MALTISNNSANSISGLLVTKGLISQDIVDQAKKSSANSGKNLINILLDNKMTAFMDMISFHVEQFLQAIEFRESGYYDPNDPLTYKIVSSWMTKFDYRDYAHIHNHGHCDISGVYYYKIGDPGTGDLFFQSPSPSMVTSFSFNHYAYKQCQIPQEGKILLFPAYLDHGVGTNESDNDRMSLSFNILFDNR